MEKMMKQQSFTPTSASTKLAMHKDSHVISKFKPKIRIIHIFAPEVIKTDAANFRQIVQSLTEKDQFPSSLRSGSELMIKEEIEELWRSSGEKINGFLDGFSDLDGFVEELSEFHSFPALRSFNYSRMDVFEDPKLV
ncbi:hypothetical protein FNV43_RR03076 [Rhamnella rubrinervis]|uniref:VQ domain-containing protein n=1 Tax=Rhamnella rubrinervis TaxID=2594499 RepID=A0A8K0HIE9_9ROSA|nr:hypothetical protein FNV43_RR03076 [Rhamnella rubrinervis]